MDTSNMKSFNPASNAGEGSGELTGMDLWQMGLRIQQSGMQQGREELIYAAIRYYNEALSLGFSPDETERVYHSLGTSYLHLWRIDHNREHLEHALSVFLQYPLTELFFSNTLLFLQVGEIYYDRYLLDKRSDDLDHAIFNFKMAEEGIEKFGLGKIPGCAEELQHLLGDSLFQKYCVSSDPEDLSESISNLEKVCLYYDHHQIIDRDTIENKHKAYYDYGLVLFHRWSLYNATSDLYASINYVLLSLRSCETYFNSYYLLRDLFYQIGKKFEGDQCTNSVLYLLLSGQADWQGNYQDLSERIPLSQAYDSLKYFQYKQSNNNLKTKDVEDLFPRMDFLVLLQFLDSKMKGGAGLRSKPVLLFYLGGIVSSYLVFDEDYDVNPSMVMTLQEQYYYVRASQLFYDHNKTLIGADSNLDYAIKTADKVNGDHYYLGQLYYLSSLSTNDEAKRVECLGFAEKHFLKCGGIWVKAMLDIVRGKDEYQAEVNDYLKLHCNNIEIISTDGVDNESFFSQFDDFFHFNEVYYACPQYFSYDGNPESPELIYFKPIWDVFRLSASDYEELTCELRRQVGLSLQREMASEVSKGSGALDEDEYLRIKDDLEPFLKVVDSDSVESTCQSFIRDSRISRKDKALLMRYLLSNQYIDDNQFFCLIKYNEYCGSIDRIDAGLGIVKTTVAGVIGYLLGRLIREGGLLELIVSALVMNLIKDEIEADVYSIFKQGLWVLANNEYLNEDVYRYSF